MAAELRETIRQALLGLSRDNPQGEGVLKAIGGKLTGFVPVVDEDYDLLREILARVLPALEQ
jgi:ABC-type phosphate/phosphonate transport system substrate-binding protein